MKPVKKKYLYRGVNQTMHDNGEGLKQKGNTFSKEIGYQGEIRYDGTWTHGDLIKNAITGHQIDSKKHPISGISTTRSLEIAKQYATYNGQNGYVYRFNREELCSAGVKEYDVSENAQNPTKPEDAEIILRSKDDSEIPFSLIDKIIEVSPL